MKELINFIQEKLIITKDSTLKIGDELSYDSFINMIHNKLKLIYKSQIIPKLTLEKNFASRFDKNAKNYRYLPLKEKDKNKWQYEYLFKLCEKILNNVDAYSSIDKNTRIIIQVARDVYVFEHINYTLDGNAEDEYYIFYIDIINKQYNIYEVIK